MSIPQLSVGQYDLIFKATSKQDNGDVWASAKSILFTVTEDSIIEGWKENVPSMAPAVRPDGKRSEFYLDPLSADYGKIEQNGVNNVDGEASTMATVTLSGNWSFYTKSGSTKGIRNARVEVLYRDQFYIWRTIATTYTSAYSGDWSVSYTPPSNHNYWEVRVYSTSSNATVKNASGGLYYSFTNYLNLANGENIGTWIVSSGTNTEKAMWVYDDAITSRNFLILGGKDPGSLNNIYWDASTTGTSYHSSGSIYLNKDAPGTSVPIHEMGHNFMYNLYGSMPPSNCPNPHTIQGKSNTGCAWVEGWAEFLPLAVTYNPTYYYGSGGSLNLENTSSFQPGDSGDDVERRVAGAL